MTEESDVVYCPHCEGEIDGSFAGQVVGCPHCVALPLLAEA